MITPAMPSPSTSGFRENFWWLATGVGIGTVFALQVLAPYIPGKTAYDLAASEAYVAELEKRLSEQSAAQQSADRETASVKAELKETQEKLAAALTDRMFVQESAYLTNFADVHIGDRVDKLQDAYSGPIEKDDDRGWWTLKIDHPAFDAIMFGFTPGDKRRKIDQIVFRPDFRKLVADKTLIHRQLLLSLGQPTGTPKDGYFFWTRVGGLSVYETNFGTVSILTDGYKPGLWPK